MAADTFDAINTNTRATGQWGKGKAPKFPVWPRPKEKLESSNGEKPKTSVADLYSKFTGTR